MLEWGMNTCMYISCVTQMSCAQGYALPSLASRLPTRSPPCPAPFSSTLPRSPRMPCGLCAHLHRQILHTFQRNGGLGDSPYRLPDSPSLQGESARRQPESPSLQGEPGWRTASHFRANYMAELAMEMSYAMRVRKREAGAQRWPCTMHRRGV